MTEEVRNIVGELRRATGFLLCRFADLKLQLIADSRRAAGKRWRMEVVLRTALVGLMAGCESIAEVEALTSNMSRDLRQKLGIMRRFPDTTLREILLRLSVDDIRGSLHALILAARRRKALTLEKGFPFHFVSLDGKVTCIPVWDPLYSQRQTHDDEQKAHGLVRMVNACLISTPAKPVIDSTPIPSSTNEMGIFPQVFANLCKTYGNLFRAVTYDAGATSEENCKLVVDAGKDFVFRIKNEAWLVHQEAVRRLGGIPLEKARAITEVLLSKSKHQRVVRRVFKCAAPELSFIWSTVKTLVRVNVQHLEGDVVTAEQDKYYLSSFGPDVLTRDQWLSVTRGHWAVENNVHWVLDAIFREDDKPWIRADPKGTVVVMLLRRIACSMLALFRVALMRKDEDRAVPWRAMLDWMHRAVIAVTADQLSELRQPRGLTVAS